MFVVRMNPFIQVMRSTNCFNLPLSVEQLELNSPWCKIKAVDELNMNNSEERSAQVVPDFQKCLSVSLTRGLLDALSWVPVCLVVLLRVCRASELHGVSLQGRRNWGTALC